MVDCDRVVARRAAMIPIVAGGKQDIVVIGGGVTGASAAYELAKAGAQVTLVERHDLNTQASGRNAGGLHGQIQLEPFLLKGERWATEFAPSLQLMRAAIRYWLELEQELGVDLEVNVSGGLIVAADEAQLRDLERKAALETSFGVEVELVDRAGLSAWPRTCRRDGRRAALPGSRDGQPPPAPRPRSGAPPQRVGARCCRRRRCTRSSAGTAGSACRRVRAGRVRPDRRLRGSRGGTGRLAGAPFGSSAGRSMVSATEPVPPLV